MRESVEGKVEERESRMERIGEIGVLKRCKNENPGERLRFQLICISNEE